MDIIHIPFSKISQTIHQGFNGSSGSIINVSSFARNSMITSEIRFPNTKEHSPIPVYPDRLIARILTHTLWIQFIFIKRNWIVSILCGNIGDFSIPIIRLVFSFKVRHQFLRIIVPD